MNDEEDDRHLPIRLVPNTSTNPRVEFPFVFVGHINASATPDIRKNLRTPFRFPLNPARRMLGLLLRLGRNLI